MMLPDLPDALVKELVKFALGLAHVRLAQMRELRDACLREDADEIRRLARLVTGIDAEPCG